MAPVTRSHVLPTEDANPGHEDEDVGTDTTDTTDTTDDDDDDGPVRSPLTNLFYSIDGLNGETQELVRELFRSPAPEETPPIVIEWCGISNDPDVYAFQLQEIVPRTIRIGSAASRIPSPSCNCTGSENKPCRHLVWLLDQIASRTMAQTEEGDHDQDHNRLLVLDPPTAFPRELGNAYTRISDFHIGVLASALHCRAEPPNGRPDGHRVREAREILAGLQGIQDDAGVDAYAPDIVGLETSALETLPQVESAYDESEGSQDEEEDVDETVEHEQTLDQHQPEQVQAHDLVERGNLQQTVLRLLVSNDHFFSMFLKLLAPHDKVRDPFRKIQQRVESVLGALRASRTTGKPRQSAAGEVITVEWAANHVQTAVHQIMRLLERCLRDATQGATQGAQGHPASWAKAGAARALVSMLTAIVSKHTRDAHAGASQDDRNLYQRMIGNSGSSSSSSDALLDALDAVHDQVQFLRQVERIRCRIQRNGYREAYMQRLDGILQRMRMIRDGNDAARQSSVGHRQVSVAGSKRPQPPRGGSEQRSKRPRD